MARTTSRTGKARPQPEAGAGGESAPHESYPLKTVSRLTGLSADIIRAWERRYGVVAPLRGPRGARLYTSDDVTRLRQLGSLVSGGRSIGDVAGLAPGELHVLAEREAQPAGAARSSGGSRIDDLVSALQSYDAPGFERLLGESLMAFGTARFVADVGAPLLERIGELWEAGNLTVAEEHVATATMRNLFGGLLRMQMPAGPPVVLLATPAGERHELGLSMVALLCLQAGVPVAGAGPDLPAGEIVSAARRSGARVVGLSTISADNRDRAASELRHIEAELPPEVEIWLGGRDAANVQATLPRSRAVVLQTLPAIETHIARIARTQDRERL